MPTVNYEHVDPTTRCHLGREFQIFRQATSVELKVCDSCGKPIRLAIKKTKDPMLDAAKTYGPGNIPLPPPMYHPTPDNPGPPPSPPSNPPSGPTGPNILTG